MLLSVNNLTKEKIDKRTINWIFTSALSKLKIKNKKAEVSVAFVGDKAIKDLNRRYLKKNTVTDVLAFSEKEKAAQFPLKTGLLGEIIISVQQAKRQAKKLDHDLKQEIQILFVHGLLHLIGYDHINIKEKGLMDKVTKMILR